MLKVLSKILLINTLVFSSFGLSKVAVFEAKDVSQNHPDLLQLESLIREYSVGYVQGDKTKLKAVTTSKFLEKLKINAPNSFAVETRDIQIVDDKFGLLIRFDYKSASELNWNQMPNGTWYRLKKQNGKWNIDALVNDYTP